MTAKKHRTHTTRTTTKVEHTLIVPMRDVLAWLQKAEGVPAVGASVYMQTGEFRHSEDVENEDIRVTWDEETTE